MRLLFGRQLRGWGKTQHPCFPLVLLFEKRAESCQISSVSDASEVQIKALEFFLFIDVLHKHHSGLVRATLECFNLGNVFFLVVGGKDTVIDLDYFELLFGVV